MLANLFWQLFAWIVTRPYVALLLIDLALDRPYTHIYGRDGELYMGRWWLFNPYPEEAKSCEDDDVVLQQLSQWNPVFRVPMALATRAMRTIRSNILPSIRIHWIRRPDNDRHLHDHPWNARTIILRGGYREERFLVPNGHAALQEFMRVKGYTGTLKFGEYHRITKVHSDGAWTLFITWKKQGSWGFNVDGVKVPHRVYAQGVRA